MILDRDEQGNVLSEECGRIHLQLAKESLRVRKIGEFDGTSFLKNEPEKDLFRAFAKDNPENGLAVGFCHKALDTLKPKVLKCNTMGKQYKMSLDSFNRKKRFLHFKQQGYELRAFILLKDFNDE